jgi:acyl-CoA synthetase (AMP-forming)/AMP-acid ligase II
VTSPGMATGPAGFRSWFQVVAATAARFPDQVALEDGERTLTYAEVVRLSQRLAGWLAARGVRPGDRLGVHLRKGVEEILATLAAVRLGAIFVHARSSVTTARST